MPTLQKVGPSSLGGDLGSSTASDILQHHSINSLLDQDFLNSQSEMSISDLLGLNSPRGFLDFASSPFNSGFYTPPANPNFQLNFDDAKFSPTGLNFSDGTPSPSGKYSLNLSLGTNTPPTTPNFYPSRAQRSTSLSSDSCGRNSSLMLDQSLFNNVNSRADSPESDSSNIDGSICDILNSLTLNDSLARNLFRNNELDIQNLQNLQAVQALKYLQQSSPGVLGSLLPNAFSSQHLLDRPIPNAASLINRPDSLQLDRAARFHQNAAASMYGSTCTWSGVLPPRTEKPACYSSKVFLGGVPWDISEQALVQTFKQFGPIRVEWPGKEKQASQPKGYVYIIFESEKNVKALLQACTNDYNNSSNWYYKISSKRMKSKEVQVIPWNLNDSNYTKFTTQKLNPATTVFVGALHGMLNAQGLAKIMNDLFDGVVYTGIDTDKYKYPIGSGRVTFNNPRSYMKAVAAAFIEIKTSKFSKKVQVDPYLDDSLCSLCGVQQGPYFCRDPMCFRYLCRTCWQWQHGSSESHHKPLTRNSKNSAIVGFHTVSPN